MIHLLRHCSSFYVSFKLIFGLRVLRWNCLYKLFERWLVISNSQSWGVLWGVCKRCMRMLLFHKICTRAHFYPVLILAFVLYFLHFFQFLKHKYQSCNEEDENTKYGDFRNWAASKSGGWAKPFPQDEEGGRDARAGGSEGPSGGQSEDSEAAAERAGDQEGGAEWIYGQQVLFFFFFLSFSLSDFDYS